MQPTTAPPRERDRTGLEAVTPELLSEVVRRIVAGIDPDKIILFGSHVQGASHETSDIDLFIVKAGVRDRRKAAGEIYGLLSDIQRDFDVLVTTPEGIQRALAAGNSFVRIRVLEEGRVLYERPAA